MNMDYSFLFNGGSTTNNTDMNGLYGSLSDLYSIKSGTYKKLVSAYYKKTSGESDEGSGSKIKGDTSSAATEQSKAAERIKSASASLSEAADALSATGSSSLFAQKDITTTGEDGQTTTTKGYDMDAILGAARKFVSSYNNFVSEAGKSTSDAVKRQGSNLVTSTATNSRLLSKAGITIDKDNKLSIDESAFKKADISTLKTLFNGRNSFADQTATKAAMVSSTASSESEMHKIYGSNGKTTDSLSSGNLLDSFF